MGSLMPKFNLFVNVLSLICSTFHSNPSFFAQLYGLKYSYLIQKIYTIICFHAFLSNTNNFLMDLLDPE